jgi:hypothetical protein
MPGKEQYIEGVQRGKLKQGKNLLLAYLKEGKKLSPQQAIRAHCYDCQGFYRDGAGDCLSDICPLRLYMPYSAIRVKGVNKGKLEGNPIDERLPDVVEIPDDDYEEEYEEEYDDDADDY